MAQILFILLLILSAIIAGQWLLANPGEVVIHWFDYDIAIHTIVVVALLAATILCTALLSVMIWKLLTWPKRRRARRQYRTLSSGLKQLTIGVTALAMGNEELAQASLKKAALALPGDPLPQLLTAQLLQRQGKIEDARAQFKTLMQHETTAALATRRLIEQHIAAHEWLEATRLTEDARTHAPKDRWLVLTLIDLYARDGNTTAMLELSEGWQWQSPLNKEERHRTAAIAHYLAAIKQPNPHKKEQFLRHCVGYAPNFLPAIIAFTEVLLEQGSARTARKWLRSAWASAPSTLLITPIIHSISHESPRAQQRLLRPFMQGTLTATHHLLAAQVACENEDFTHAKACVTEALALEETQFACSLMATIEQELRGIDAANAWLARALDAPASESWICHDCGTAHTAWQAHCSHCTHFDSLRYERPESRITSVELATSPNT